ncbi:MAG: hypothetical protein IPP49_20895 [Saprospiraceae bacterium]|nr:hypothetical protein [Saprospiraceae bacterium]
MTITSFNYYSWSNLNEFVEFIDQSFKQIQEKGLKNLIIDVRYNTGGSQSSAIHLLRYLVDKPFTYYSKSDFPGKLVKIEGGRNHPTCEKRLQWKSAVFDRWKWKLHHGSFYVSRQSFEIGHYHR